MGTNLKDISQISILRFVEIVTNYLSSKELCEFLNTNSLKYCVQRQHKCR